jgi:hypothetical protein
MINNKKNIRMDIIDDIAFGIYFREYLQSNFKMYVIPKEAYKIIPDFDLNYGYSIPDNIKYSLIKDYINNNIICYRNKNTIKSNNLKQIEYLVDILITYGN